MSRCQFHVGQHFQIKDIGKKEKKAGREWLGRLDFLVKVIVHAVSSSRIHIKDSIQNAERSITQNEVNVGYDDRSYLESVFNGEEPGKQISV